ncbi:MAG: iron ABC transporter permease [Acidobacteria bacterium]|nr:iron ABC transporter permease [Acidobacteriota bacterium]
MSRFWVSLTVAGALLVAASIVSLATGAAHVPAGDAFRALFDPSSVDATTVTIVRSIRAPRVATACIVGWALALAGLCFQSLLRNPLASEYTLGVSSGAALGAVATAVFGIAGAVAVPTGAFVGAIATIAIVLVVAHASFSFETTSTILAGIIFTSLANALLSLMLTLIAPDELQSFFFWFLGSFASAEWGMIGPVAAVVGLLSLVLMGHAWHMNAISVNEELAEQVGISVTRSKLVLYGVASLLTATVVTLAGTIGFVGLVVPHVARLAVGVDNRRLIPLAALSGAALCVMSDLAARTILAPNELPVGVVTAFIGVPVFVSLMRRRGR